MIQGRWIKVIINKFFLATTGINVLYRREIPENSIPYFYSTAHDQPMDPNICDSKSGT